MRIKRKIIIINTILSLSLMVVLAIGILKSLYLSSEGREAVAFASAEEDYYSSMDYSAYAVYDPRTFDTDSDDNTFNYLPEVKNQGKLGLCWAYAIAGSIEIDLLKNFNKDVDIAEKYIAYYTKNGYDTNSSSSTYGDGYKADDGSGGVDYNEIFNGGGAFAYTLHTLISGCGLNEQDYTDNTFSVDSYLGFGGVDFEKYRNGKVAQVVGTEKYSGVTSVEIIKDVIVGNGSVISCVQMEELSDHFYNDFTYSYYASSMYFTKTDHMIEIVGWDDNYSKLNFKTNPTANGAWLVRNSWGTSWGDDGYVWISYEDMGILTTGYYTIDIEEYDANEVLYQYDVGTNVVVSMTNSPITYANIFTNDKLYEQQIEAVGLYIETENGAAMQNTEIKIYMSNDVMSNPIDGRLVKTISKSFNNDGFYKIDLDENITLSSGMCFSVVVTNSSSIIAYACFEGEEDSVSGNYRQSCANVSFIKNGTQWVDTSNEIGGYTYNNAGIKAFAKYTECLEHNYDDGKYIASTCKDYAKTIYSCKVCGHEKVEVDESSTLADHTHVSVGHKEGNCVTFGYTTYMCSVCDDIKIVNDIEYGLHGFIENYHVDGNCKIYGYTVEQYCKYCGLESGNKVQDKEKGEHNYIEKSIITSDCCNYEKVIKQCESCEDLITVVNSAKGYGHHKLTVIETIEGGERVRCSVVGCNYGVTVFINDEKVIVDASDVEQIEFDFNKIDLKNKEVVVQTKYGNIIFNIDNIGASKNDYFEICIMKKTYNELSHNYLIEQELKENTFYYIDFLKNDESVGAFVVELYVDTSGYDVANFYKLKIEERGENIEAELKDGVIKATLTTGVFSPILHQKEDVGFASIGFEIEYVIIIGLIIFMIIIGELSAKSYRKKKREE